MKVLIISSGEDSGGVGNAIKRAFDKHTDWEVRQVRFHNNYIDYPGDITLSGANLAEVDDLFEQADVIHFMERWWGRNRYANWDSKPKVMHHHGTIFRQDPALVQQAQDYGAISIVATIDLLLQAQPGELRWIPNPVDLDLMADIRLKHYAPNTRLLVAHAPTGREKKGTALWLQALEGLPVGVLLIEGKPWAECLRLKARADVLLDQLHVGYGLNAVEAWAMGIPVVSGVADQNIADRMKQIIGYLPFLCVTPQTAPEGVAAIIGDADIRQRYTTLGSAYAHDFHDERKVVDQWQHVYTEAREQALERAA